MSYRHVVSGIHANVFSFLTRWLCPHMWNFPLRKNTKSIVSGIDFGIFDGMKPTCSDFSYRHRNCRTFCDWFGSLLLEVIILVDAIASISTGIEHIVSELDKPSKLSFSLFRCTPTRSTENFSKVVRVGSVTLKTTRQSLTYCSYIILYLLLNISFLMNKHSLWVWFKFLWNFYTFILNTKFIHQKSFSSG